MWSYAEECHPARRTGWGGTYWDFGDGVTSALQNPTHVYANNGLYDVTLTVGTGAYTNTLKQTGFIVVGPPHRTVISYTYDGLYRLTDANYSTGERFQYAYDSVGNRTTQTATITSTQVTSYVYDAANRLTSVNGQAYTWDDNPTPLRCGDFAVIWSTMARRLTLSRKRRAGPAAIKRIN